MPLGLVKGHDIVHINIIKVKLQRRMPQAAWSMPVASYRFVDNQPANLCTEVCRLVVHRRGQMGSGSQVLIIRLGSLVQRLTVYTVATVNFICLLHWTTNL